MSDPVVNILRDLANKIESNDKTIDGFIVAIKKKSRGTIVVCSDDTYGLKSAINRATKKD